MERVIGAVLALVLAAASCDGGDGGRAVSEGTATTAVATTAAAPPPAAETSVTEACAFAGGAGEQRVDPEGGLLFLRSVAVSVEQPGCRERVVFEFEDTDAVVRLGYQVGPAEPPFAGPDGMPVAVEGEAFLRVVLLNGTGVDLSSAEPRETYTGARRIRSPETAFVVEVHEISDFEGVAEWVIGLDAARPFAARVLTDPPRLVVEVGPLDAA